MTEGDFDNIDTNLSELPEWLCGSDEYVAPSDHDAFIRKSILSITSMLSHFRLDDGKAAKRDFSAPAKILFDIICIVLVSLSKNYVFSLFILAGALVRLCFLRSDALKRTVTIATLAAMLSALIMLPSVLIGQSHSIILIPTKVFISISLILSTTLSTPFNKMTSGLRAFHIPNMIIMVLDLALKNIVSLGDVALQLLTALKCRSVGKNNDKASSIGGVGGVVLLKSQEAAQATYEAMVCRGFDGEYTPPRKNQWKLADLVLLGLLAIIIALFIYLQHVV